MAQGPSGHGHRYLIPGNRDIGTVTADGTCDTPLPFSDPCARRGPDHPDPQEWPVVAGRKRQPRSPETKLRGPPDTSAGSSRSAGQDTMPAIASKRTLSWFAGKPLPGSGCAASSPSASASPPATRIARPPKSTSASPSQTAATLWVPQRSSAQSDVRGEKGNHDSSRSAATMPGRCHKIYPGGRDARDDLSDYGLGHVYS